ncbi:MAG: glycosyltransferase family 2 protein [Terracidiphilus sp.]|nr:glycosyltransferase family 2 protein [Terracidiphilus sp.]
MITQNEAENLPRTLASVRFADEIVVVDSGSTDGTVDLARAAGARVFEEPWKGFAAQKNAAIEHTTCEWVLSLDADEEVSAELAREIEALLDGEPECAAYRIPRLNHFLGAPLKHGGYWPDPKLRLFRRGAARFRERAVHETMEMVGETSGKVGQLRGHLIHHCYATLDEYVEHMNRYSTAAARQLVAEGRAPRTVAGLAWQAVANPAATFAYNYFVRLGFLDGAAGLVQHLNHSAYIHWKYVKAWRMRTEQ